MKIFISHSRKDSKIRDQLRIDQLSTSVKDLQTVSRALRTIEKKWEKSDPTAYRRWLSAFIDFYEEERQGDLAKDITRICKRWNSDNTEQKDLLDTAPMLTIMANYALQFRAATVWTPVLKKLIRTSLFTNSQKVQIN